MKENRTDNLFIKRNPQHLCSRIHFFICRALSKTELTKCFIEPQNQKMKYSTLPPEIYSKITDSLFFIGKNA